jgi:beta-galactosidase
MKKLIVSLLLTLFCLVAIAQEAKTTPGTFTLGNKTFLLNNKPYVIRAGELHYPRIPRAYWEQRIQMCKAMGLNTICIYLFWNFHEQAPDQFNFKGQADVAEFVRLIQKNGMYCIVRPGPYVCAEWDMGGLPWWLLKKKDLSVRNRNDAYFMERAEIYLKQVGRQLAPLQIQNGGPIIMVQVENEYATFGRDKAYMEQMRELDRKAGFDKVQLVRCDWSSNFTNYTLDGVATALNFGSGSNIDNEFKKFNELYPDAPKMCGEYWSGWFDYWGQPHETRSVASLTGSLKDMMDRKISFSLYMAHGGTTFAQWGGANDGPYRTNTASYDYDAPISENGHPNVKFEALRDVLKNYLNEGETLPKAPADYPMIAIPKFQLTETANLFSNLPKAIPSEEIQPMEMFDQGWGRIVYRTKLQPSAAAGKLIITEVKDWALVFLNGKQIGKLNRRLGENTVELPVITKATQLDILVEAMGRVNYGRTIADRKGITQKVELVTNSLTTSLKNWEVFNLPVDYGIPGKLKFTPSRADGPAWYRGSFTLTATGDTYLDMTTWGKGMVWVNGYNLGRYWKIGPQQTLFMPGCWLRKGRNEIVVLDLETPGSTTISGITTPILNKISPDETLLHRRKGETLRLAGETPVVTSTITPGNGWKEIPFNAIVEGRYLCLEALNSQNPNDKATSIAELEVVQEDGTLMPRTNWKTLYADSEEVTTSNSAADRVFDQQESTIWQTATSTGKLPHPHQLVIDLGANVRVRALRYLPRTDRSTAGMIKDFRLFLKTKPFTF